MSVQAPEPVQASRSIRTPDAPTREPRVAPDDPSPPPRRRSRFGYLWLRALILLLGMLLGAALLATFQATGKLPPPPPITSRTAEQESDVVVSIREAYLNRVIAERTADPAQAGPIRNLQVNVRPDRQLQFVGDVHVFNQRLEANAGGIIGVA